MQLAAAINADAGVVAGQREHAVLDPAVQRVLGVHRTLGRERDSGQAENRLTGADRASSSRWPSVPSPTREYRPRVLRAIAATAIHPNCAGR